MPLVSIWRREEQCCFWPFSEGGATRGGQPGSEGGRVHFVGNLDFVVIISGGGSPPPLSPPPPPLRGGGGGGGVLLPESTCDTKVFSTAFGSHPKVVSVTARPGPFRIHVQIEVYCNIERDMMDE